MHLPLVSISPPPLQPDLGIVRRALGRTPQKVLLAGRGAQEEEPVWKALGAHTRVLASDADPRSAGEPWDVVVLDGALELERWDRWYLQRVHRVLAPGGVLQISVPNMLDVWSPGGAAHFLSRVGRELQRRLSPRSAIPAADRSAFVGRRFRQGPLAAMLEGLAFEVVEQGTTGHGLPAFLRGALGPWEARTARRLLLTARKLPSLWGIGRTFPPCDATRAAFRAAHEDPVRALEVWRARIGTTGPAADLDVADWARRGALVFSPHPDDEVIGCGGTLLAIVERQGAVTIVQVTDGSDSAAFITEPESVRRQVRLDEARVVADRLGARELVCLRADNRALRATPELEDRFLEVLEHTRAGIVFAPALTDFHPDHQTVLRLLAGALGRMTSPRPDVALYEVWGLVAATHVHDVGHEIDRIEDLLLLYETALKIDDYVHLVAERLLDHSCEHRGRPGYAEVFEVMGADRFLELAREHSSEAPR